MKEEKKMKIEQENQTNDQQPSNNSIEIPTETIPVTCFSSFLLQHLFLILKPPPIPSNSGVIRLKIKLGKPSISTEEPLPPPPTTNFIDNIQPVQPE